MATTLRQGQQFTDTQGRTGTVGFDTATGAPIAPGQTTSIATPTQTVNVGTLANPSYQTSSVTNAGTQPVLNPTIVGTQPYNIPQPTANNGASANSAAMVDSTFSIPVIDPNAPKDQTRKTLSTAVSDIYNKMGTKTARTNEINKEEGLQSKKDEVDKIARDARALDDAFNTRVENILRSGGGTLQQAQPQIEALRRGYNAEKTRLAIQSEVASGNYTRAYEIAKSKIDEEFAPLETQLKGLEMQINFFQNDMTESQKMQADQAFQLKRDSINSARDLANYKAKAAIDAGINGANAGIDPKVLATDQFKKAQAAQNLKNTLDRARDAVTKYGNFEILDASGRGELNSLKTELRSVISTALEQGVVQPGEAAAFDAIAGNIQGGPFLRNARTLSGINSVLATANSRLDTQAAALQSAYGIDRDRLNTALGVSNTSSDNPWASALGQETPATPQFSYFTNGTFNIPK